MRTLVKPRRKSPLNLRIPVKIKLFQFRGRLSVVLTKLPMVSGVPSLILFLVLFVTPVRCFGPGRVRRRIMIPTPLKMRLVTVLVKKRLFLLIWLNRLLAGDNVAGQFLGNFGPEGAT